MEWNIACPKPMLLLLLCHPQLCPLCSNTPSSREHAALCPMFFGVKAVLAKSFARIHRDNLINYAVLPLAFSDEADYDALDPEDQLEMSDVRQRLEDGATRIPVYNRTKQTTFETTLELTDRERQIVLAGGLLRYVGKESGR